MSLKKVNPEQPKTFEFNEKTKNIAQEILKKYPEKNKKSAVMPFLYLAQKQNNNWIPLAAIKYISKYLSMPYISVYEVATFYSMFNLSPVGKYFIQVCTTTPCLIRGADKIVKVCKEKISDKENQISKNGECSWTEVECLGACVNAPMMQINNDYYEDLDEKSTAKIIDSIFKDKLLKPGSYRGRKNTSPENVKTINGQNMLKEENKIFKNLYNNLGWEIDKAIERDDWKDTKEIISKGKEWIINEVKTSELRGRGGAGFSTGMKWSFAPKKIGSRPHYLVINADESEPGTCKDRDILRFEPQKLIEGCLIAGYATGAHVCYIYIRGEYSFEGQRLQDAINQAYKRNFLGKMLVDLAGILIFIFIMVLELIFVEKKQRF